MEELYTIGDAAEQLGMTASTIRYYERNGLLPHVRRSKGGARCFDEESLEWLRLIERLKATGMSLKQIRKFVELYVQGDETIEERRRLIHEQHDAINRKIAELQEARDFIEYKCWFYDVAAESGTCETPRTMPEDEIPHAVKETWKRCRIDRI